MYAIQNWPTPQEVGISDEDAIHKWEERVAICTIDGELDEQAGRRVAWEQVLPELGQVRLRTPPQGRLQHA